MDIRLAEPGDARGIATVHVRAWRAAYRGIVPDEVLDRLSVDERERVWREILDDRVGSSLTVVVLGLAGDVQGFSSVSTPSRDEDAGPATAELTATYVDPDCWRRGIGNALLRAAFAGLMERGDWREATLWVFRENERARSFYEGRGWKPDGAAKTHEPSGHEVIRMRTDLEGSAVTFEAVPAEEGRYVPAGGRAAFTSAYDLTMRLTMREAAWRPRLVRDVLEGQPDSVLDLGCGTGTLTLALEAAAPQIHLVGVDGDPQVLDRARGKAKQGSSIQWVEALADRLPFVDGSFDRVVSSLLLHHLAPEAKTAALIEARRVLRPGGRLHVADWGRPRGVLMGAGFFALRLVDGFENTRDHARGRIPAMLAAAGFREVRLEQRLRTGWGSLELLAARA